MPERISSMIVKSGSLTYSLEWQGELKESGTCGRGNKACLLGREIRRVLLSAIPNCPSQIQFRFSQEID